MAFSPVFAVFAAIPNAAAFQPLVRHGTLLWIFAVDLVVWRSVCWGAFLTDFEHCAFDCYAFGRSLLLSCLAIVRVLFFSLLCITRRCQAEEVTWRSVVQCESCVSCVL